MKLRCLLYLLVFAMLGCQREEKQLEPFDAFQSLLDDFTGKYLHYRQLGLALDGQLTDPALRLSGLDGQKRSLQDLFTQEGLLIFRYSNISCTDCTNLILGKLKEFHRAHPEKQIAIIASYDNFRAYAGFLRTNNTGVPVYFLEKEQAAGVFNPNFPPFLFVVGKDRAIQYPHFPIKEIEGDVEMYLNFIKTVI